MCAYRSYSGTGWHRDVTNSTGTVHPSIYPCMCYEVGHTYYFTYETGALQASSQPQQIVFISFYILEVLVLSDIQTLTFMKLLFAISVGIIMISVTLLLCVCYIY